MAMTQRARNLFGLPRMHLLDDKDGYRIQCARILLSDAQNYISVHDFRNALSCIAEGQQRLLGIPKYLAVRDQLEDALRIARSGMAKGLR